MMPTGMGGGRPDDAAREKMSAMMDKQNAEIRAVLDDTQKKAFDKNIEEMKKRREHMRSTPEELEISGQLSGSRALTV